MGCLASELEFLCSSLGAVSSMLFLGVAQVNLISNYGSFSGMIESGRVGLTLGNVVMLGVSCTCLGECCLFLESLRGLLDNFSLLNFSVMDWYSSSSLEDVCTWAASFL